MRVKYILAIIAAVVISGCTTSPTIDTSAEATFDGLYPIKGARADQAWARNDVDLTVYSKIMLQSVGVEYRPGGESNRSFAARSSGGPYEVTEAQKEQFQAVMREAFLEELGKSKRFTFTTEPGPDVLLIRAALLDVVSWVPPEPVGVRSNVYLSKVGEASLVLELRDSITETILARAIDRRAAEGSMGMRESNRVNNRTEIRRLARIWGSMLRDRLDELAAPAE